MNKPMGNPMIGGHVLAQSLVNLGVRRAFGVPGESYLALLDGLYDLQGDLEFIGCKQEGGAAFMAAAYGKLTGQPGLCLVTRGPGATNAAIGVHTAMQDSAPMIMLVGDVATHMRGREAFQEIDFPALFAPMAKLAVTIDQVDRIPEVMARAWRVATTGRPGPVVIALPEDMLSAPTTVAPLKPLGAVHGQGHGQVYGRAYEPEPSPAAMAALRDHLSQAQRPLMLVGGCNWTDKGRKALQAFADNADIPVVSIFRYQDQYDNFSKTFCGEAGVGMIPSVKRLIGQADMILAINNRFGEMSTDGYRLLTAPHPQQRLIHVHESDRELGKVYQPDVAIQSGPNAFAQALAAMGDNMGGSMKGAADRAPWRAQGRMDYEASLVAPPQPSPVDMAAVMAHLRQMLPADVILTNGAGNFTVWPNKFFAFGPAARLLAPQSGAMGYGVPAAIAAKIAAPERTVVCFAGDGDFQMNGQELATAQQYGACPIILILNNGTYGTIRAHQERTYPGRVSGTDMTSPDFAALARAYGFYGERVETTEAFPAAFDRALAAKTGAILDLNISAEALTPRQTLSDMRAAAQRA